MATFKIGINMAGAVSAGAYTAGVLDFLTEALDEWYKAKADPANNIPRHDVSIEVFSGASAGGMCSAISAVQLQTAFNHIHDTAEFDGSGNRIVTTNLLYESWVNKIDILPLLDTSDLKKGRPVVSLLNSAVIAEIAGYALTPPSPLPAPRPWVSPNLALFLSLTNLRGTPYSLNAAAPGSLEETTFFYGSRIAFRTSRSSSNSPFTGVWHTLDLTTPGATGGWQTLQTAAMATGAFPVFLAPRILKRYISEFVPPHWLSVNIDAVGPPSPVPPSFPLNFPQPFDTLNVDGGITNNDPFNFAHDYLAKLEPATGGQNPRSPLEADRAVINIAPFPTVDRFDAHFNAEANSFVLTAFGKLFSALISQARFYGESLGDIMCGTTFSRFIIAPSDSVTADTHHSAGGHPANAPAALQCASLGAFGGFFDRKFRAHDYALGRRNCQKFLRDSFVLPTGNPIIASGLDSFDEKTRDEVIARYKQPPPGNYTFTAQEMQARDIPLPKVQADAGNEWMPIIPLCTRSVAEDLPAVPRQKMSRQRLELIVKLVVHRYKAVVGRLIDPIPSPLFRWFLRAGQPFIAFWLKGLIRKGLVASLGSDLE